MAANPPRKAKLTTAATLFTTPDTTHQITDSAPAAPAVHRGRVRRGSGGRCSRCGCRGRGCSKLRAAWPSTLILNPHPPTTFPATAEAGTETLESSVADAISLGTLWLANPDPDARIKAGGPFTVSVVRLQLARTCVQTLWNRQFRTFCTAPGSARRRPAGRFGQRATRHRSLALTVVGLSCRTMLTDVRSARAGCHRGRHDVRSPRSGTGR